MARKRSTPSDPSSSSASIKNTRSKKSKQEDVKSEIGIEDETVVKVEAVVTSTITISTSVKKIEVDEEEDPESRFIGEPVPDAEARIRWPHRYQEKKIAAKGSYKKDEDEVTQAKTHYTQAEIDGKSIANLYDDAYVKAGDGEDNYICKIIEMFEAVDGSLYFTAQWFYRARDTAIKNHSHLIDGKRVFFSDVTDDNPLDCLVEKLNIVKVPLNIDLEAQRTAIPDCDYYYNMLYQLPYCSFIKAPQDIVGAGSDSISTVSSEVNINGGTCDLKSDSEDATHIQAPKKSEMLLLDLYSGCGAMSTGICLGAHISGLNLVTKWAVDINEDACKSLKLNHPETEVRNEPAEDFLSLIKEWEKLCIIFSLIDGDVQDQYFDPTDAEDDESDDENHSNNGEDDDDGIFEVEKIIAICYGDPNEKGNRGLYFKVHWKGYESDRDSWEPLEGLRHCRERIKEFVTSGYKSKLFPLPGDVDVICGGPPCQGISGFNRFRNKLDPLKDKKNEQLIVFMNIVDHLKPKFVLMENVVDLIKFAGGFLGRYGLGRLIQMNYQTRMGMMAAGAYGLPQFRMRVFIWGARPTENLPQYALPTHDVIVRGVVPLEFENCTVAYDEGCKPQLERKLLLEDAISDLPPVTNDEQRDEMPYGKAPQTDFQRFIRLGKNELLNLTLPKSKPSRQTLFDHQPLNLNVDDYDRVCQIPKRKGANYRDLPGVRVRSDNTVEFDPNMERVLLRSGKPLVPDYAMTFVKGTSSKPFARLWWDETVPTVVTRAEPHNQQILHPEQDRVLSIRENARLQGFPDYYKLCGSIKQRYIQVGNAVAVPVARALGYALGLAFQGSTSDGPLFALPPKFPNTIEPLSPVVSDDNAPLVVSDDNAPLVVSDDNAPLVVLE